MGVFKNEVGRPSNKTIMLRRIIKVSALVLIIGFFGMTLYFFGNNKAGKLKGAAASNVFEDKNFYRCVVDQYKNSVDSSVSYNVNLTDEQLKKITSLSCYKKNITSTKGIEKLVSLEKLWFNYNNINSIDLSKNSKLAYLELRGNKLTKIDLSKNIELYHIDLIKNELKEIDISQNSKLVNLYLGQNKLNKIDVTNNFKLRNLFLEYNNLTKIDVDKNGELRDLRLTENSLSKISINQNSELVLLYLGKNKLSEIDISKNTRLKKLRLSENNLKKINIKENTNLIEFGFRNNKLTEIDLSKNSKLDYLNLSNNKLTKVDLSKNSKLDYLNLSNNKLTKVDLSKNAELEELYLDNNELTKIDLSKNTKLKKLSLNRLKLKQLNLNNNKNLIELDLEDYTREDKEFNSIGTLDLRNNIKLSMSIRNSVKKIIIPDNSNIKITDLSDEKKAEIIKKSLQLECPSSVIQGKEFTCKTGLSGSTLRVSKANLSKGYENELKTKSNNKIIKAKYTTPGYIYVKVSKEGYKTVTKKIQVLSNILDLICPKTAKVNEWFKCTSDRGNIKITASKSGFDGEKLSKTTKEDDKTLSLKYNKAGIITVTVSGSGYKTVSKQVKIVLDDSLKLNCPATAKVNELFKCTSNLAGVNITASKEGFSGNVLTYTTTSKDKVKDLRYNKTGTITVTASKSGYKTVSKQVKIKLDDSLKLKCPESSKVNEWFKCTSNLPGVKITASSAGFSGNVLSYTTTSSDKVKDLRYNKAGTITVTASKSGYKTVNKKVVIK